MGKWPNTQGGETKSGLEIQNNIDNLVKRKMLVEEYKYWVWWQSRPCQSSPVHQLSSMSSVAHRLTGLLPSHLYTIIASTNLSFTCTKISSPPKANLLYLAVFKHSSNRQNTTHTPSTVDQEAVRHTNVSYCSLVWRSPTKYEICTERLSSLT